MITRRPALLSSAAAVVLAASGCAFLPDLAEPDPPAAAPSVSAPAAVPPPPEPVEVATAVLTDRDELLDFSGTVRVTVSPAAGLPPLPGTFAADCALADDGSVRTTAVDIGFTDTSRTAMAGRARHRHADGDRRWPAPTRLGRLRRVLGPRRALVPGRHDHADRRRVRDPRTGRGRGDGHRLRRRAGRGIRRGLVLRVSGLRNEAGSNATGPWDRVTADRGGCPDDPAALCAPLG